MINRRSRILKSPKLIQKKRKKLIVTTSLFTLCGILAVVFVVLLLRLSIFQISNIKVTGTEKIDTSEIEKKVLATFEGDYLGIIPKSNDIFYSKSLIEKTLLDSFKKIDSLEISHRGTTGIEINIKERITVALVCAGFHGDGENQKCYSADKNGYVFEESPNFSDGVYPHYYANLDNNSTSTIGNFFIESDLFLKLQKFIDTIKNAHISVDGLLIGERDEYELYIKNIDSSEAVVYFDNRLPFDKISSNLILFWNDSVSKKKNTTTTPVFDYINLRFGNNIFYVTK